MEREERSDHSRAQERLRETLDRDRGAGVERDAGDDRPSIRERLDELLNKPRERLDIEEKREVERDGDEREIHREVDRDRGLSH